MRTIIDLPERDLRVLTELGKERGMSRAEIIRQALTIFLKLHKKTPDTFFGLWKERTADGAKYQQLLRDEWSE